MASPPDRRDGFEVAIICATAIECDAVTLLVDDWYEDGRFGKAPGDANKYQLGRMGNVNIVLLRLTDAGKVAAARAAASLRSSYTGVKMLLLAGTCAGVPSTAEDQELLLGDVVISKSLVQYDNGRQYDGTFEMKNGNEDSFGRPTQRIRSLIATLEVEQWREQLESQAAGFLEQLQAQASSRRRQSKYSYPGTAKDVLFESSHLHKHRRSTPHACAECSSCHSACCQSRRLSCEELGCSDTRTVIRRLRLESKRTLEREGAINEAQAPAVVFGCFGSADRVMKSGEERDRLAREHKIVAFEMEGAGIWDELPCIIVKGISDYADSHKNDTWQAFAAATAAAVTKALLTLHIQQMLDSPQNSRGQSTGRADRPHNGRQMSKNRSFGTGLRCYRCDRDSHLLEDCYARDETVDKGRETRFDENRCLNCGEEDHYWESCRWQDLMDRRDEYRYRWQR